MKIRSVAATVVAAVSATAAVAAPPPRETLHAAKKVLEELADKPAKGIPAKLLQEAEAVVIVPNTIKAGLVIGGRGGHGVAVIKDKAGGWGDIRFIDLGGASVGLQAGVESTDVVLVFKNRKGLERLLDGKAKLKLGADASVAAGPVGREAAIATDLLLKSEIFSYSRSRGLFAGVSLDGVVLDVNNKMTAEFEKDAQEGTKKAADELKMSLALHTGKPGGPQPPMPMPVPPPVITIPPAVELPPPQPAVVPPPATVPADPQTGPVRRFFKRLRGD